MKMNLYYLYYHLTKTRFETEAQGNQYSKWPT